MLRHAPVPLRHRPPDALSAQARRMVCLTAALPASGAATPGTTTIPSKPESFLAVGHGVALMGAHSRSRTRCYSTVWGLPLLFAAALVGLAPAQSPPAKPARTPWTTSRVTGSPDPPAPYKVVRAFPNL